MEVTLNEKEIQDLFTFANDLPTKYGMPLVQFLNNKLPKQEPQEPQFEGPKEEKPVKKLKN